MVKAIFLGTGSAGGSPRLGHTDQQCLAARKSGSKTARRRSSLFVDENGVKLLIDAGPDVLAQLADAHIEKIDAVMLTHAHSDAAGGLRLLNSWLAKRRLVVPLFALAGAFAKLDIGRLKQFNPTPLVPGQRIFIGSADILPFRVVHGIRLKTPTVGFRIDGLVYASDMESALPASYKIMRRACVLVIDGTFWDKKSLPGHMTVVEAIALAERLCPDQLFLTQIGHAYPPHEEAQKKIAAFVKRKGVPFPVRLAYDGLGFSI
jgi:phosphoribosyl 1,2-cyclic phosphate phosphodiesterase